MEDSLVLLDWPEPSIARITLRRPPLNALSGALLLELAEIIAELEKHNDLGAVIVAGSDRAFAAGADVSEFTGAAAATTVNKTFRRAFDSLAALTHPVIAAIRGFALGGGLELALACDLRIAGDTARLGQPEILLGIIPGAGGTQRLPRLVGPARAKDMVWTGRMLRADEALAIGLIDRIVPDAEVDNAALDLARTLATGASVAISLAKKVIDSGLNRDLATGLDFEADAFVATFATNDAEIGINSFLADGPGKAKFTGT